MACAQVIGNDTAITLGGCLGQLRAQRHAAGAWPATSWSRRTLLAATSRLLADRCVDGIEADVERARELAEGSPSIVTPLNRYIGYEAAAAVAKQSIKERRTIRDVVHRAWSRRARRAHRGSSSTRPSTCSR